MGNGFTFELESLIFFAAAQAVQEYLEHENPDRDASGPISVYGDDVILPRRCYELFSSFSAFLGFTVNNDKSFSTSYFRESCGAHYFDGVDCKPIFLKERLRNASSVYKLANSVRWLAHRRNTYYGCDSSLRNCWANLFRRVPKPLRLRIPVGKGEGGFIGNFDEATPTAARNGIEGFLFKQLIEVGVSTEFEELGLLLAQLRALPSSDAYSDMEWTTPNDYADFFSGFRDFDENGDVTTRLKVLSSQVRGNSYTLRGRTKLKFTSSLVRQWYNLGPWV
jgi:hypothetical protein